MNTNTTKQNSTNGNDSPPPSTKRYPKWFDPRTWTDFMAPPDKPKKEISLLQEVFQESEGELSTIDEHHSVGNFVVAGEVNEGHTNNQRPSNREKHEQGDTRRKRDRGGEKGDDKRRPPRKRPLGHKGPWSSQNPNFEILLMQEIFQEAENESYTQEFEDGSNDAPPTRRDGAAARAVDRQKDTDQMPPTRRDGISARRMDEQKMADMRFTNPKAPRRFGGFQSPPRTGRKPQAEISLLGEIFADAN